MFLGTQGRKQLATLGGVSLVGIEMAVSILVGYLGGRWLDVKFGTAPWLQWIGLGYGIVAAFRSLYRMARKEQNRLSAEAARERDEKAPERAPD